MNINTRKTVTTVSRDSLNAAKYINVQFVTKDDKTGKVADVTLLLGRGDEEYIRRILQITNEYLDDETMKPLFEIQ